MTFYCNSPFSFKVHIIKHLRLHFLTGYSIGVFEQAIGSCTLTMINMGDNAKIADSVHS